MRIKEQEKRLTLNEHDDDDDDEILVFSIVSSTVTLFTDGFLIKNEESNRQPA